MKVNIKHGTVEWKDGWFSKSEKPSVRVHVELTEEEKAIGEEIGLYGLLVKSKLIAVDAKHPTRNLLTYEQVLQGVELPFHTTEHAKAFEAQVMDALKQMKERLEANKGGREDKTIEL